MGINERVKLLFSGTTLVLLISSLLFSSCEQPTDGCLDFRALSVGIDADDACSDCCVYPVLDLQLIPVRYDADTFQKTLFSSDTLSFGGLSAIGAELGFYLHDIFLIAEDGTRLEMMDTMTVFSSSRDSDFLFESSILYVKPFTQYSNELGTLLEEQTFVAVEAKLGLPEALSELDLGNQPTTSPLYRGTDSLLVSSADDSYLDAAFKYEPINDTRDSFFLDDNSDYPMRWDFSAPVDYQPSYNLQVSLGLPVDLLLSLNNGTVNGELFVTEFLEQTQVLEISLTR